MDKHQFRSKENKLRFKDDFSNTYAIIAGFVLVGFITLCLFRFIPIISKFFSYGA